MPGETLTTHPISHSPCNPPERAQTHGEGPAEEVRGGQRTGRESRVRAASWGGFAHWWGPWQDEGRTALHLCYRYGHRELAEYLVSKGADDTLKDQQAGFCNSMSADRVLSLFTQVTVTQPTRNCLVDATLQHIVSERPTVWGALWDPSPTLDGDPHSLCPGEDMLRRACCRQSCAEHSRGASPFEWSPYRRVLTGAGRSRGSSSSTQHRVSAHTCVSASVELRRIASG